MAIQILRDIKGLRVQAIHPNDPEGKQLVDHLKRIGCFVETTWPIPEAYADNADVVLLTIEQEDRDGLLKLMRSRAEAPPTVIAIVGYENPSTLALLLESGALAVIERPIKPFGLLTQIALARSLWLERKEQARRLRKLERKLNGIQQIQKAKTILMANQGISEEEAFQTIRRQAMSKRVPMEEMASAIINANELLNFRADGA
ncbi:AmiR/NasT family two-component response regulator [Methylopila capsulata]|uniref:AmiR/NasT family two-component response regulator n=1 Tax=Methylopila capsulata TaxID=61654 RepID=A0A9W6IPV4_9HYPH|nr:ANTAR domain-containing protein [Methylopila capsulata]MBM7850950.1 AmiR/NasT family two-component response regulator [Methylopila capsulata]GLK54008.1 transcription antitermination regulator [Methylopila capsulata]